MRLFGRVRACSAALRALIAAGALIASGAGARAEDGVGHPVPGQIGFQVGVTDIARDIHGFYDNLLFPIITVISLFVMVLIGICMVRFNERANPVPSKTTHNALLEVAWTIVPVLILVVIAIPSFRLLTKQLELPKPDITIKATGKQWYWSYDYPKDQDGGFNFDSARVEEKDAKTVPDFINLLSVDNEAVVPVNKNIQVNVTGADVIHGFIVQSLGVRIDAVPGRLNSTWFRADREGIYYGQCSKLCGKDHAYMPIAIRVVSQPAYEAWLQDAKKKYAQTGQPQRFADASSALAGVAATTDQR
ncbi:cytochrome c oxidase subunit II [Lichenibacterium minor]|uniref:Cytochrome c oxidase subunit 2 n=1 Tax=Lichenibacterium minor TaxID=2316528 RepID=A0A4Q2UAL7_9HYPH|nr:cytochrome c oxidase subunit II [Lichenibacterium minor]RYC32116.1 cytochrome c oxidase subunit II [Lichenibacterium minor]